MNKKCFLFFLICAVLCLFATAALANTYVRIGDLTYEVDPGSRYAAVYSCDRRATDVEIVDKVNGYPVDRIQAAAFANCPKLRSVIFPETLEIIASAAFMDCECLTSVELPEHIKVLFSTAFQNCVNLQKITLNSDMTVIGKKAFDGCVSLSSVRIPKSMTYMAPDALPEYTAVICRQGTYGESWAIENNHAHRYSGTVTVTSVTLDPSKKTLKLTSDGNDSVQLSATVFPAEASATELVWKSSDKSVAKVDKTGLVTPVAPGKAVITCTSSDEGAVSASCDITVQESLVTSFRVVRENEDEDLANTSFSMKQGTKLALFAVDIRPKNAYRQDIIWKSDNKEVAKVNSEGLLRAVAPGKAKITVSSADGNFSLSFTVRVK